MTLAAEREKKETKVSEGNNNGNREKLKSSLQLSWSKRPTIKGV